MIAHTVRCDTRGCTAVGPESETVGGATAAAVNAGWSVHAFDLCPVHRVAVKGKGKR